MLNSLVKKQQYAVLTEGGMERVKVPLWNKDRWGPFQGHSVCSSLTCPWLYPWKIFLYMWFFVRLPFSVFFFSQGSKVKWFITDIHWYIAGTYLFMMKSLSHESPSLCASVFDQFWKCAQSYQAQILDRSQPLPFSAKIKILLTVESCGGAGRGQNSFSRKGWRHLTSSEYCHSILT